MKIWHFGLVTFAMVIAAPPFVLHSVGYTVANDPLYYQQMKGLYEGIGIYWLAMLAFIYSAEKARARAKDAENDNHHPT
jgi:hypothetical protein